MTMANKRQRRAQAQTANLGPQAPAFDPRGVVADPKFKPVDPTHAKLGWRAWAVDRELPKYGLPPKLESVTHSYAWLPKRKSEAECARASSHDGVPGEDCGCGFYSAKNLRHLMNMGYHQYTDIDASKSFKVVGQIACWGKVIEATQGWRSQYAYPVYLMVPFEMGVEFGRALKDAYGCKVRLLNFLKDPGEITDEFIEGLLNGTPQLKPMTAPKRKGRIVEHKQLRFTGRCASEPYMTENGRKVIKVAWDVTPDQAVVVAIENLQFDAI